jgi:hypothetical protein
LLWNDAKHQLHTQIEGKGYPDMPPTPRFRVFIDGERRPELDPMAGNS